MRRQLAHLWARHRLLFVAFVVAALLALLFSVRTAVILVYWSDPTHRDQEIAGWMTPRYVAMSWDVPPEIVADALGLERDGAGRRITMQELAEAREAEISDLAAEIKAAITAHRISE